MVYIPAKKYDWKHLDGVKEAYEDVVEWKPEVAKEKGMQTLIKWINRVITKKKLEKDEVPEYRREEIFGKVQIGKERLKFLLSRMHRDRCIRLAEEETTRKQSGRPAWTEALWKKLDEIEKKLDVLLKQ